MKAKTCCQIAAVLCLIGLSGCGKPAFSPPAQPKATANENTDSSQEIKFGGRYVLTQAQVTPRIDGLAVDLDWKSLEDQNLDGLVPVHVIDAKSNIIVQRDFKQSPDDRAVKRGDTWHDKVLISYDKITPECQKLAIGLMSSTKQWLLPESGERDWGNRRVVFPLPSGLPSKSSTFQGFLERVSPQVIHGWVCNTETPDTAIEVAILDGDRPLTNIVASVERPDLAKGGYGNGNHGFRLQTPTILKDGSAHTVRVRIAGTPLELRNSPQILVCTNK
jgi:hypothetical protein